MTPAEEEETIFSLIVAAAEAGSAAPTGPEMAAAIRRSYTTARDVRQRLADAGRIRMIRTGHCVPPVIEVVGTGKRTRAASRSDYGGGFMNGAVREAILPQERPVKPCPAVMPGLSPNCFR